MRLESLGWNDHFVAQFAPHAEQGLVPGRVVGQARDRYLVYGDFDSVAAEVSGRFRFEARERADFPVVGDWVALTPRQDNAVSTIHRVLARTSAFARKQAGLIAEQQVLAANIDTVFIIAGLDHEFNARRVERYVVTAWDSGAMPVLVLNKADLCENTASHVEEAQLSAPAVPVLTVSAHTGQGIESLARFMAPGTTGVFLGSSGVGKSSLVNRLAGTDLQATTEVRIGDSRGRHTTTTRELIRLPGGGMVIDTPGLRELQLWADDDDVDIAFADIAELARGCRFDDCRHEHEPGCAVKDAVGRGLLPEERLRSYGRLQREQQRIALRRRLRESQVDKGRVKRASRSREGTVHGRFQRPNP